MTGRLMIPMLAVLLAASAASQSRVQIGYCAPLKDVSAAKHAGFDYVELSTTEIAALSDADFEQTVATLTDTGLPVPVTNLFLPAVLKVTGPEADTARQMAYVAKAFDRVARLGVRIVVFGSGGARRVPEGYPRDDAVRQMVDFGRRIAPLAQARGLTVAIEPLRREETNIINSAAEGLDLVEAVRDPAFQLMIDFFHLSREHEDPRIVVRAASHLRHIHLANPEGRVFPLAYDEYDYEPFFANLRNIGYDQRISIEASTTDLQRDGPRAIALVRRALGR
jgi:D-psicose/D-tagatose/L-ribulose 3-epimerase